MSLLEFVKSNLETKKNLPVVILCNKTDDQDDEEQEELVLEAQCKVEKIFGVSDRKGAFKKFFQHAILPRISPPMLSGVSLEIPGATTTK